MKIVLKNCPRIKKAFTLEQVMLQSWSNIKRKIICDQLCDKT